jgi:DNA-binding response OmpR family regulator
MTARLCLVEDDPIMGESLHQRLSLEGFLCDWHRTGAAALASIGQERYAAVVSDVRLPDISGEALFRAALDRDEHAPPFIFVTAYGSIDRAVELIKLGAADYVTKPFDVEQLVAKLRVLAGVPEEVPVAARRAELGTSFSSPVNRALARSALRRYCIGSEMSTAARHSSP